MSASTKSIEKDIKGVKKEVKRERRGQWMPKVIEKRKPNWRSVMDTINTLPEEQQATLFNSLSEQVTQLQNPLPETALLSTLSTLEILKQTYEPFPLGLKMTVGNIMEHLDEELGDYLKEFDADQDYFYLDQLRKIEPRTSEMYDKLKYEHKKDKSVLRLTDIVPKKSERITKEIMNVDDFSSDIRKLSNIYLAQKNRLERSENKQSLAL